MNTKHLILPAIFALTLTACGDMSQPIFGLPSTGSGNSAGKTATASGALDCGAGSIRHLSGESAKVLEGINMPAGYRLITPGMAVTADYDPGRLNVEVTGKNNISRIYCG